MFLGYFMVHFRGAFTTNHHPAGDPAGKSMIHFVSLIKSVIYSVTVGEQGFEMYCLIPIYNRNIFADVIPYSGTEKAIGL